MPNLPCHPPAGFSVIELVVVMLCLGALTSIALPALGGPRNDSKDAVAQHNVRVAYSVAKAYFATGETYAGFDPPALAADSPLTGTFATDVLVPGPTADPALISIVTADAVQIELCAASRGQRVFCIRDRGNGPRYADASGSYTALGPYASTWSDSEAGIAADDPLPGTLTASSGSSNGGTTGQSGSGGGTGTSTGSGSGSTGGSTGSGGGSTGGSGGGGTPSGGIVIGSMPVAGMVGLDSISAKNNLSASAPVATNGQLTAGNNSSLSGVQLSYNASNPSFGAHSSIGEVTRRTVDQGPFVLAPVVMQGSENTNDNPALLNQTAGSVQYTAASRSLVLGNNASITLNSGTYNLCSLSMGNSSTISVAAGATVVFLLDSPDRPGSGCPAGSGTWTMGQNITLANSGPASEFQIGIYGFADGSQTVSFNNSFSFTGVLYAPQTNLVFKNSAQITGALGAKSITAKNSLDFSWDPSLG